MYRYVAPFGGCVALIHDWREYIPNGECIPAWSLHRLIEMSLNLSYGVAYCYTAGSNMNVTYDEVIDMIEWAISRECFNKDYLEENEVD